MKSDLTKESLASYIEHTALGLTVTREKVRQLCIEALHHSFLAICVPGASVRLCSEILTGSKVGICGVLSFPFGADSTYAKVCAAVDLVKNGAGQVDMVMNIGMFSDGDYAGVERDIQRVCEAVEGAATVKVIICTGTLKTNELIAKACKLVVAAGAHYVKTETGFALDKAGATVEHVRLMRKTVDAECQQLGLPRVHIKAAGGIRTFEGARVMIDAGARCIGTSAGPAIIQGFEAAA